jgi:hypothetical protein
VGLDLTAYPLGAEKKCVISHFDLGIPLLSEGHPNAMLQQRRRDFGPEASFNEALCFYQGLQWNGFHRGAISVATFDATGVRKGYHPAVATNNMDAEHELYFMVKLCANGNSPDGGNWLGFRVCGRRTSSLTRGDKLAISYRASHRPQSRAQSNWET